MRGARRFRWLLRLLPLEMREAHGREMEQVFRDAYGSRRRTLGSAAAFWWRTTLDVLRVAPREQLEALAQDTRYAVRTFRRAPAFTIAAVLTVALGTGSATAVFAVVNAVLVRPLPYDDPDRVAIVWARTPDGARTWLASAELDDIRQRVPAFQCVAGLTDLEMALSGSAAPEHVRALGVSAALLDVFGVRPVIGRGFTSAEDVAEGPLVALLAEDLWRRRFGARGDVLGTAVWLDGRSYSVVGVLPRSFSIPPPSAVFPARVDVWVPLQSHLALRGRDVRLLHVVGRLAPDASIAAARTQLAAAGASVSRLYAEYRGRAWSFDAIPLQQDVVRSVRPALLVLFAVVVLVMLIACGNVAALLLSRGAARAQEISVRTALGASAARLTRQLVTEGLILALAGGTIGLTLAATTPALARVPPLDSIPRFDGVVIDWRVALFALGASLATAALFMLAPLASVVRRDTTLDALRARGGAPASIHAGRALAVVEIALACVVLTVAVLLSRSFVSLVRVDPGFEVARVLTFRVGLTPKYRTAAAISGFFDATVDRLRALPGVEAVGGVTQLPLSGAMLGSSFILAPRGGTRVDADFRGVTPGYFDALGIPVVEGRGIEEADRAGSAPVVVVDELFARKAWPGERAVGKKLRWFRQPEVELDVVGVVGAVRHRGHATEARETVYRPHTQYARASMFMAVRTSGDPYAHAAAAVDVMRQLDADQPVAELTTMDALATRSVAQPGFTAALSSAIAAIALLLTMVGTYGLFAYAVAQRQREIGVRLALGGRPSRIAALIVREGLGLAAAGLCLGVPLTVAALRGTRHLLPLAEGVDAAAICGAVALILLTTGVACWIPARRAARVSPMASLRAEP